MSGWSIAELMATVLSREIRDGDVVITGTNASIPAAAYRMAQLAGRRVVAISGGVGCVDPTAAVLPPSAGDEALREGRFRMSFPDVVRTELRGAIDVIFLGAIQIDRRGRCNLVAVGDYERPRLRGPGTLGLSLLATFPRAYLYLMRHDTRTFVDEVDFVSAEGLRGERGVQRIVTPLGVLGPSADRTTLKLASFHPGTTAQEVAAATGFDLDVSDAVETEPPSAEELAALRSVDTAGELAGSDVGHR